MVAAAEKESSPAGGKRSYAGDEVLDGEVYSAEAGLKDKAHVENEYQDKVHGKGVLLEKGHENEPEKVQTKHNSAQSEHGADIVVLAVEEDVCQHSAVSDKNE